MKISYISVNESTDTNKIIYYVLLQLAKEKNYSFNKPNFVSENIIDIFDGEIYKYESDCYIFDYSAFYKYNQEYFIESIDKFNKAKKANIIMHLPDYDEDSSIAVSLRSIGLSKIITDNKNQNRLKEKLHYFLTTSPSILDEEYTESVIEARSSYNENLSEGDSFFLGNIENREKLELNELEMNGNIRIAVCGILPRIGTTRIALQLAKAANYFKLDSSAYIEINGRYIDNLSKYYEVKEIENGISFEDIPLYKNLALSNIQQKGYAHLIYDFGVINNENVISILDKDIIIVVGSSGPSEIGAFTSAIELTIKSLATKYVFYDVPKNDAERDELKSLMMEKANNTFFIEHTSDPFNLNMENIKNYKELLKNNNKISENEVRKRRKTVRIFGK